jgi:hypothetical protein
LVALGVGSADGFDEICGNRSGLIAPRGPNVAENGGDLIVREHATLGRHFEVVGFPQNINWAVKAVEDDFDRAVRISGDPRAGREGWQGSASGSFSIGSVTG